MSELIIGNHYGEVRTECFSVANRLYDEMRNPKYMIRLNDFFQPTMLKNTYGWENGKIYAKEVIYKRRWFNYY